VSTPSTHDRDAGDSRRAWLEAIRTGAGLISAALAALVGSSTSTGPSWIRYLLIVVLCLLALCLAGALPWRWLTARGRAALQAYRTKNALRECLRGLAPFMGRLHGIVERTGYQNSLPAVVDGLASDAARFEAIHSTAGLLSLLGKWSSFMSGELEVVCSNVTPNAAEHLLLQLQFILRELEELAKACEKHIPARDDTDDGIHSEPQPNTELRKRWKQFCADYNHLVEAYEAINRECARHLPSRGDVRFDRL